MLSPILAFLIAFTWLAHFNLNPELSYGACFLAMLASVIVFIVRQPNRRPYIKTATVVTAVGIPVFLALGFMVAVVGHASNAEYYGGVIWATFLALIVSMMIVSLVMRGKDGIVGLVIGVAVSLIVGRTWTLLIAPGFGATIPVADFASSWLELRDSLSRAFIAPLIFGLFIGTDLWPIRAALLDAKKRKTVLITIAVIAITGLTIRIVDQKAGYYKTFGWWELEQAGIHR